MLTTLPSVPSGITPAARAAITICCLGISITSSFGAKPQSSAKSSLPRLKATTRGEARTIAAICLERGRGLDQQHEAGAAMRHARALLALADQFVEQAHMRGPFDLGDASGRAPPGPTAASMSRTAMRQRTVDAHQHVGAGLPNRARRGGDGGARRFLLRDRHAVFEIELHGVGAARDAPSRRSAARGPARTGSSASWARADGAGRCRREVMAAPQSDVMLRSFATLAPLGDFVGEEGGELGRRQLPGLGAFAGVQLAHFGRFAGCADLGIEHVDDRLRRLGRREHAPPRPRVEKPGTTSAMAGRSGVKLERLSDVTAIGRMLLGLQRAAHRCGGRHHHLQVAAHHVRHRVRDALVRHVHRLRAGHHVEQLAAHVADRADAGRAVVDAALRVARRFEVLRGRLVRRRACRRSAASGRGEQRHRREGLQRVVAQVLLDGGVGREAHRGEQQRGAVGLGTAPPCRCRSRRRRRACCRRSR